MPLDQFPRLLQIVHRDAVRREVRQPRRGLTGQDGVEVARADDVDDVLAAA